MSYLEVKIMKKYLLAILCLSCTEAIIPIDTFNDSQDLGVIENKGQIPEASGIVASYRNKGYLWTHNDSGDRNRIFLLDSKGQGTREFNLEGATNRDWEAISMAQFPEGSYIYVGEIGDNNAVHPESAIYRVLEPDINATTAQSVTLKGVQKITFKYPDGPRDAECFLIDQVTKDIFIISKRENTKRLYKLPYPQSYTQTTTVEFVQELNFSNIPGTPSYITDGNVSVDNKEIIIKNYLQIFHWRRNTDESIPDALKRTPKMQPYFVEPQGEGICFAQDGSGYYTLSEEGPKKLPVKLYFYKRK